MSAREAIKKSIGVVEDVKEFDVSGFEYHSGCWVNGVGTVYIYGTDGSLPVPWRSVKKWTKLRDDWGVYGIMAVL